MMSLAAVTRSIPSRAWSLLLIGVLCVATLSACKDANDPACANPDDPPLLSAGDSGGPLCDAPDPDCEGCGGAWGDPHITTLDGLVYDLQAVGEFTAAAFGSTEVQARFAPWGASRTVSLVTGVAIATDQGDASLILEPGTGELSVRIDGEEQDLAEGSVRLGEALLGVAPGGDVVMAWPDGTMVAVKKYSGYLTLLVNVASGANPVGLLGDVDGDTADAFTTRDREDLGLDVTSAQLYGDFAESWRITDESSAFWYSDGTSTETFTDRTFPDAPLDAAGLDAGARSAAAAVCADAGVTQEAVLDACIVDVATTGDAGFAEAAIDAQKRMTTTVWRASGGPSSATGATWVSTLDGLSLALDDRYIASDSTRAYVLASEASGETYVVAVDGATGEELWRTAGAVAACGVGVLDDERLVVVGRADGDLATDDGPSVVLLDAATGSVAASAAWDGLPAGPVRCSPMAVAGSTVAIATGSTRVTGWQIGDSPALAWSIDGLVNTGADIVAAAGGFVVTTQADGGGRQAMMINGADGSVVATQPLSGKDLASSGVSMVSDNNTVVVSLLGDALEDNRLGTVTAFDATGADLVPAWTFEVWGPQANKDPEHTFARTLSSFSLADGLVVGHAGNELIAWDSSNGDLLWRYVPSGFRWSEAPALISDGVIWDGAFGGPLVSRVSTEGEFLGEDFGDDLIEGGSRSASATVFGPAIGGVVMVASQSEDGAVVLWGLAAEQNGQ